MVFSNRRFQSMRRNEYLSIAVICLCILAIVSDWLFTDWLPRLHGRYSPVVSHLTITRIVEAAGNSYGSVVTGWAEKFYDDCDYVGIDWRLGERGGRNAAVGAHFMDPAQIRDAGRLEWDALYVDLSPSQVVSLSFANVEHDCGLWWPVISPFFDGTNARDRATFDMIERVIVEAGNEQIVATGYEEYVNAYE